MIINMRIYMVSMAVYQCTAPFFTIFYHFLPFFTLVCFVYFFCRLRNHLRMPHTTHNFHNWKRFLKKWNIIKYKLYTNVAKDNRWLSSRLRSKISSDQKRFFIVLSLYPLSFFANTPFKTRNRIFTDLWKFYKAKSKSTWF